MTDPSGKVVLIKDAGEAGSTKSLEKTCDINGFNTLGAKGRWTLKVVDGAAQDSGPINGVKLSLK